MADTKNSTAPYADYAEKYRALGWVGVLPLPAGKKLPPPSGFTGHSAPDPDEAQVKEWVEWNGDGNIALRLPDGVIALDLDLYKAGAPEAWQEAERELEALPPTWVATSRGDGSGKLLFRVPPGTRLRGKAPWGEVLQRHHRYVMAPPSINGDDRGAGVRWISPDGELVDLPCRLEELPELPDPWVEYLSKPEPPPPNEVLEPLCARLPGEWASSVSKVMAAWQVATGSRYDAMVRTQQALANYAYAKWPGAEDALIQLEHEYVARVADTRPSKMAAGEFARALKGARENAVTTRVPTWDPRFGKLNIGPGRESPDRADAPATKVAEEDDLPLLVELRLKWPQFWEEDSSGEDWVFPSVLARGRGHVIYAKFKQGKSLFTLFMAAQLATGEEKIAVVYVDYEMTPDDVRERLEDMGYGPSTDLSRLAYLLLPNLPPLDTKKGGQVIKRLVDEMEAEFPQHHVLLVIDTTARAVAGKENEADTYKDLYRETGTMLKRRGVTWVRLDHAGKDLEAGMRGSSSKGDDVDVIWRLEVSGGAVTLHRDAARMGWVPERVGFTMAEAPLRYVAGLHGYRAGAKDLATQLDGLGAPAGCSRSEARKILAAAEIKVSNAALADAIRYRKEQATRTTSIRLVK